MARLWLVFNPVAARHDPRAMRAATRVFLRAGWDVEVVGTTRPGEAGDLARAGVDEGAEAVAVYGGDGTVLQAAAGLVDREIPMVLLPGGTGNQLARNLRIPTNPTAAAQLLLGGISRAIDLGRWTPDGGVSRTFGVACGAGYDAAIMNSTTRGMKRWLKTGAYLMQSLRNLKHLRPVPYRAIVDGVNLEGEAATILIANCARLFPPYFPIRPTVVPDDGMLDLVAVRADGLWSGLAAVRDLARARPDPGRIRHVQGRHLRVEMMPPGPTQHDGENGGVTPFTAEVLPGALRLFVPAAA